MKNCNQSQLYLPNQHLEGSLIIKILKRTAEFTIETVDFYDKQNDRSGSLQIPKKTKVFIEQTIRERENAPGSNLFEIYRFYPTQMCLTFNSLYSTSFQRSITIS